MARQYPADLLAAMLADDPGRPRLTWYDDEPGPTVGERIELSAKVLGNWVNKAGNLLQDDLAAGPGTTVGIDLPTHWRACYWALAAWGVGASVVIGSDVLDADVLVTADPGRARAHAGDAVLVSLPALARSHPDSADAGGAIDEARELSTHGDQFVALADPEPADLALSDRGHDTTYGSLVTTEAGWGQAPRVALNGPLGEVLRQALIAWAGRGSVVLSRGVAPNEARRLESEGVTHTTA